jgi:hypothetical protein
MGAKAAPLSTKVQEVKKKSLRSGENDRQEKGCFKDCGEIRRRGLYAPFKKSSLAVLPGFNKVNVSQISFVVT